MKVYKYCKKALTYKPVSFKLYSIALLVLALVFGAGFLTSTFYKPCVKQMPEEQMVFVINKNINSSFSAGQFYNYLKELNVKFPEVVFAQACLETGNFKSKIFRDNHNCFGMKLSGRRPTTTHELENDHALYSNWKESVVDYAFYQAYFLSDLKTKQEYMSFIEANYSETPGYTQRLLGIANNVEKHIKSITD